MPARPHQDRWLDLAQACAVVVLLVGLALLVVVGLTEGVGKASTWASVLGTSLAIVSAIVLLDTSRRRRRAVAAAPAAPEQLAQAANVLAGIVSEQWRREAEARALGDPEPMPVRWRLSEPAMMDHPQVIAPGGLAFSGRSDQMTPLAGEFRRLDRRRLVITGGPGSGKTTLAVQLLLELLTHPQPGEPVPVLFSLVGWDPQSQPRVQDWLTARLEQDYPALRSLGANTARALVERGMILPILDGLDEVSDQYRAEIIARLNASLAADTGLILTSRSTEFSTTVTASDVLTAAAVIAPEPLSATEAAAYLRTAVPPNLSASWSPVLAALDTGTAATLAQLVSRPLGLWLVRSVHIDGRLDPAPLIDDTYPTAGALQAHLFDELIPAAIRSRPPVAADPLRPDRSYHPEDVRRWLGYLARQMTAAGTRDWRWWHLVRHTINASLFRLVVGLVVGLSFGLTVGRDFDPVFALAVGLVVGLATWLVFGLTPGLAKEPAQADMRLRGRSAELRQSLARFGLLGGLIGGLPGGLIGGLIGGLTAGPPFGLAVGRSWLKLGLSVGLTAGLALGLLEFASSPSIAQRASSPMGSLRGDRALSTVRAVTFGLAVGLPFGLMVGLTDGLMDGLMVGLSFGLTAGLTGGLVVSAWAGFCIASLRLAARRRLPLRLMGFLQDAYRLGLLRIVGSSYQFRHAELQDHLARDSRTQRPVTGSC